MLFQPKYSRLLTSIGLLFSICLLSYCASRESPVNLDTPASSQEESALTKNTATTASIPLPPEAKVIRNAALRFQVKDFTQSLKHIQNNLKPYGAYLSSSQSSRQDNQLETTLEIRVPGQNLDPLLDKLVQESINLDFRNISSEDVTTEFVDMHARLKAKKAVEARFLDLLNQAKTINDILQVERELKNIQEEIETIQGRMNYINARAAFSTITLTIYENNISAPGANQFLVRVSNALKFGWELCLSLLIGLLYVWPVLLLLPAIVLGTRKFLRRYPPVR
jgi:hypothetical protein